MLKNKLILSTILIIFALGVAAQEKSLSGNINEIPIRMTLVRDGGKLSGTYLYSKVGKQIELEGSVDAENKFILRETSNGKVTGEFSGEWEETANTNGASLYGEWKKTGAKDPLFFWVAEEFLEWTNGAKIIDRQFLESSKPKRYAIDVSYPEISGLNALVAAKINRALKGQGMLYVPVFRKGMVGYTKADLKTLTSDLSLDVGYAVEWATDDFISVSFTHSTYEGGVHPNSYSTTLTFDLKSGKEVKLADLFKVKSGYLKVLSNYSIKSLTAKLGEDSDANWIKTGAGAKANNYGSWNLTKKGLMITFDAYQVAPYAAGPQTIIIPYAKLEKIWRVDKIYFAK